MTSPTALMKALCRAGFEENQVEVSDTSLSLKGYKGDIREGKKAHVRIKGSGWRGHNYVGGASNDLGWETKSDGTMDFHVSDYDIHKYDRKWQAQLLQYYGAERAKELAKQSQFREVLEEVTEEQKIHIRFESLY